MKNIRILVATWSDGLLELVGDGESHEFAGQTVAGLAGDGRGGALAIVGRRSLRQRKSDAGWRAICTADVDLACCVVVRDLIYVGTDDARILRIGADGQASYLRGFDAVDGRETWYAGSAVIDGQRVGPPLGIRSLAAAPDGSVLFANVHVGGIPRSTDGGNTWQPTIHVDADVHEVCAHPTRKGVVMAAAAMGLCTSHDSGATWRIDNAGLHATYCSAVAFLGDDVLVAASTDHFAQAGAIYRRPVARDVPLQPLDGGFPRWIEGIADTGCIAVNGSIAAIADRGGNLYVSRNAGRTWSIAAQGLAHPSGVLII